jgi:hypothetical protein
MTWNGRSVGLLADTHGRDLLPGVERRLARSARSAPTMTIWNRLGRDVPLGGCWLPNDADSRRRRSSGRIRVSLLRPYLAAEEIVDRRKGLEEPVAHSVSPIG